MSRQMMEVLQRHEQEDKQAVYALPWQEIMRSQFVNAEEVIALAQARMDGAGLQIESVQNLYQVIQMSQGPLSIPVLVRTESRFFMHKHTASIYAYYHSHDFYELLYVYQGQCIVDNDCAWWR